MTKTFDFKHQGVDRIYKAILDECNREYNVYWLDDSMQTQSVEYSIRNARENVKDGTWIIIPDDINGIYKRITEIE